MDRLISYAQNNEDLLIEAFFPDVTTGFYVDIGANHPIYESVTKRFYDKGWTGINIEPNHRLHILLNEHRKNDKNLDIGISDHKGQLTFREYQVGDGLSTFSQTMKQEYKKHESNITDSYVDRNVDVYTLEDIFDQYGVSRINFLKIDVEGYEYEVLKGNNWKKYRPELICIEANHIENDWRPLLKEAGYSNVFFDGLNEYYLSRESIHRKELFSYPNAILLREPLVSFRIEEYIKHLEDARDAASVKEFTLNTEIKCLNERIVFLEKEIERRSTIQQQALGLAKAVDRKVLRHINKLQEKPTAKRQLHPALTIKKDDTAEDILHAVRLNDIHDTYDNQQQPKNYRYIMAHKTYSQARRAAKKVVKGMYKSAKYLRARKGDVEK